MSVPALPAQSRRRLRRTLAVAALTLAALGAGPTVGSAMAGNITISDASGNEGNSLIFTVTISGSGPATTVNVSSTSLSATKSSDFSGGDATLNFSGGNQSQTVTVSTFCDGFFEGNEQFQMTISGGGGHTITDSTGVGTIFDGCGFGGSVDLQMFKSDSPDPVRVGDTLGYALAVQNFGPNVAQNVTVTDTLPPGVTFVSVVPGQGSCSGTTTITCNLGNINSGGTAYIEIRVIPTAAGTITNTASVSSSNSDFNGANNSASTQTTVTTDAAPPPADDAVDERAPIANLSGPRRCELPSCEIDVRSNEDGQAVAVGDVIIGNVRTARRVWFFRRARRSIEAGQEETLRLRLRPRARRAIRRALRNRRRVRAEVEVIISDAQDNERLRRRTLRIVD